MPVRLLRPQYGQAANTTYWDTAAVEDTLRSTGNADDRLELASDYQQAARTVTAATANVTRSVADYLMTSAAAQVLTLGTTGTWPIGAVITISQMGAGATTVTPATGITILTNLTSLVTKGQYSIGQLKKVGPATWLAFGGFGG